MYAGAERRAHRPSPSWLLLGAGLAAAIAFATLCPLHWRPHLTDNADEERFLAFLALGFAAKLAFPRRHIWTVLTVVALALGLEAAQLLVPGRDGRMADALVKATGAACGVQIGLIALMAKRAAFRRGGRRASVQI